MGGPTTNVGVIEKVSYNGSYIYFKERHFCKVPNRVVQYNYFECGDSKEYVIRANTIPYDVMKSKYCIPLKHYSDCRLLKTFCVKNVFFLLLFIELYKVDTVWSTQKRFLVDFLRNIRHTCEVLL